MSAHVGPTPLIENIAFHQFSRLPLEIRLMIWGHAATQQRIVNIYESTVTQHLTRPHPTLSDWGTTQTWLFEAPIINYESNTPVPAILHTCWEARNAGLEAGYEKLVLDWDFTGTYINWKHDFLATLEGNKVLYNLINRSGEETHELIRTKCRNLILLAERETPFDISSSFTACRQLVLVPLQRFEHLAEHDLVSRTSIPWQGSPKTRRCSFGYGATSCIVARNAIRHFYELLVAKTSSRDSHNPYIRKKVGMNIDLRGAKIVSAPYRGKTEERR